MTAGDEDSADAERLVVISTDFETFFALHHSDVVRALSLTLGDVEFGREAASEGFTRALQRWKTVALYSNPAGWVYRVGLNWARSWRRKSRREEVGLSVDEAAPTAPTRDAALIAALRQLSLEHRAVVVARYYLDWSEADTASALEIPAGTVKSRLSRALINLADLLEGDHD